MCFDSEFLDFDLIDFGTVSIVSLKWLMVLDETLNRLFQDKDHHQITMTTKIQSGYEFSTMYTTFALVSSMI